MTNNTKRPDITTDLLNSLYQQGLSSEQIGKKLGIAKSSVSRRLKKANVRLRSSSDYSGSNRYWLWKGENYLDPLTRKRNQRKHRVWAEAVKLRDKYTCQDCSKSNIRLHAHHVISLKECINTFLEFDVSNGITLCVPCHGSRHKKQNNI